MHHLQLGMSMVVQVDLLVVQSQAQVILLLGLHGEIQTSDVEGK
jgi:hypothetical protein